MPRDVLMPKQVFRCASAAHGTPLLASNDDA
jgi:hypothetical protein